MSKEAEKYYNDNHKPAENKLIEGKEYISFGEHIRLSDGYAQSKPVSNEDEKYDSNLFQWLYNYTMKQDISDERTAIIRALKDKGCV